MLFSDINLDGIESEMMNSFEGEIPDIEIILDIPDDSFNDFNNRVVNPENINEIITLCDYLMIKATLQFIMKFSTPTTKSYVLNDYNKKHFTLPEFMTKIMCENIAKHGLLNWLVYAHENGCELTKDSYQAAAKNEHFDCLKYIVMNY